MSSLPLPRFLLADDGEDPGRDFVVHLASPRFVVELNVGPPVIQWLEPPMFDPDRGTPDDQAANLLVDALMFLSRIEGEGEHAGQEPVYPPP